MPRGVPTSCYLLLRVSILETHLSPVLVPLDHNSLKTETSIGDFNY